MSTQQASSYSSRDAPPLLQRKINGHIVNVIPHECHVCGLPKRHSDKNFVTVREILPTVCKPKVTPAMDNMRGLCVLGYSAWSRTISLY